jgi:hypothetical protein
MVPNMNLVFSQFDRMTAIAGEAHDAMQKIEEQLLGPVAQAQRTAIEMLDQVVQFNRNECKS